MEMTAPSRCTRLRAVICSSSITRVSKRTIQRYQRELKPPSNAHQMWLTFVHNHAQDIWACDFLQVSDLLFRSLFCFFLVGVGSRKVVHVAITRHPTDMWVAQQLRQSTSFGHGPKYLIRDNDSKYGALFDRVAAGAGIKVLRTPFRAPRANPIVERFIGSVRRECLDHLLLVSEPHLARVVKAYVHDFNEARPHQGIGQRIPAASTTSDTPPPTAGKVISIPVLGGLHHVYCWVA